MSIIQITNYYIKQIKWHCQDNRGVYHIVPRTKARDKIVIMYNMLIIYSSKKDTLEGENAKIYTSA